MADIDSHSLNSHCLPENLSQADADRRQAARGFHEARLSDAWKDEHTPAAPRLDAADTNEHGFTRMDMVRSLLGDDLQGKNDTEIRQAFCTAFARHGGWNLTFDGTPSAMVSLYFESRFDEWRGLPEPVDLSTLRMDGNLN